MATTTDEIAEILCKAQARIVLGAAWEKYMGMQVNVQVSSKEKHVFAAKDFEVGELLLVPMSASLSFIPEGDKVGNNQVRLELSYKSPATGKNVFVYVSPKPLEENKKNPDAPYDKTMVVSYWLVGTTDVKAFGNMIRSSVLSGAGTKVDSGKPVWSNGVSIPVLTNDKAVTKGDELLIFKAAVAKVALKLDVASDAKKRRRKA